MVEKNEIYKCNVCNIVVEILDEGVGTLSCCNQPMELMKEKISDEGQEKHVPVIEKTENKLIVKVGSVLHPMEEKHYIEWIELIADGRVYRKFLKPGMRPEARFQINPKTLSARAFCNLHGLWKSK